MFVSGLELLCDLSSHINDLIHHNKLAQIWSGSGKKAQAAGL